MSRNRLEEDRHASTEAPSVHEPPLVPLVDASRRRLFRGLGGGAGVLMAVSAKSALGGTVCKSPSAMMSGNTSPRPTTSTCSGGLSPGYWVQPQHSPNWSQVVGSPAAVFPQFNGQLTTCTTSTNQVTFGDITNQGTTLQSVFKGWAPVGNVGPVSMWWVIYSPNDAMFGGPSGVGQLLRHLSCAWLNAGYFQSSSAQYPMTQAQVQDIWKQLSTTGLYCPALMSCSKPWTASDVINYISGLYDVNAPVDNLCKK